VDPVEFAVGDQPTPAMYRAIAETSVNPFAIVDDDGTLRWVGESIEDLLGWKPHEVVGRRMDVLVAPHSMADVLTAFTALAEEPARTDHPRGGVGQAADLICRDGGVVPCSLVAAPRAQTGLPYHLVFARRAGFERALDNALEAIVAQADVDQVLEHLVLSLTQSIPECVVTIVDGWQGRGFSVCVGDGLDLLVDDPDSPWARALTTHSDVVASLDEMPPAVVGRARARGIDSCWVHPVVLPGEVAPAAALVMWRPADGIPTQYTWRAVHRTGRLLQLTLQWDRSHRALEFAATHDTLTGLANRLAFVARLEEVAKRSEGEAAMLFVDLDGFKPVNDRHGHLAGDRLLQDVGDRLTRALRPGDLVARFGGDEFAVLCERFGDGRTAAHVAHDPSDGSLARVREAACAVADRLSKALATPFELDSGARVAITASIGVTPIGPSEVPEAILDRADSAMRHAKAQGRDRWVAFDPPLP
jgi:PAS domain S-box-containing protein